MALIAGSCTIMGAMNQAPTPAVIQAATQKNPGFFKRWGQYFWPTKPSISTTNALYYGIPSRAYYHINAHGQETGFLRTLNAHKPADRAITINRLITYKKFRNQGTGSALLQKALDDARDERIKTVRWYAIPIDGSHWSSQQLDAWYIQQIKKWAKKNHADVARMEIKGPIDHEFQVVLTYPEECVEGYY